MNRKIEQRITYYGKVSKNGQENPLIWEVKNNRWWVNGYAYEKEGLKELKKAIEDILNQSN